MVSKSLGRRARAQGACVPVTHVPRCVRAAGVLVGSIPAAKAEPDHARRQAHEVLALQGVCDAPEGAGVKHDGGTLYIALQCIRFAPALQAQRFIRMCVWAGIHGSSTHTCMH